MHFRTSQPDVDLVVAVAISVTPAMMLPSWMSGLASPLMLAPLLVSFTPASMLVLLSMVEHRTLTFRDVICLYVLFDFVRRRCNSIYLPGPSRIVVADYREDNSPFEHVHTGRPSGKDTSHPHAESRRKMAFIPSKAHLLRTVP